MGRATRGKAQRGRYRELLPVFDDANIVTLGEGWTPILSAPRLGAGLKLPNLSIKEEGYNPTGSFKARGLALAVSKAKELGLSKYTNMSVRKR